MTAAVGYRWHAAVRYGLVPATQISILYISSLKLLEMIWSAHKDTKVRGVEVGLDQSPWSLDMKVPDWWEGTGDAVPSASGLRGSTNFPSPSREHIDRLSSCG